jgi:hypothetical protein
MVSLILVLIITGVLGSFDGVRLDSYRCSRVLRLSNLDECLVSIQALPSSEVADLLPQVKCSVSATMFGYFRVDRSDVYHFMLDGENVGGVLFIDGVPLIHAGIEMSRLNTTRSLHLRSNVLHNMTVEVFSTSASARSVRVRYGVRGSTDFAPVPTFFSHNSTFLLKYPLSILHCFTILILRPFLCIACGDGVLNGEESNSSSVFFCDVDVAAAAASEVGGMSKRFRSASSPRLTLNAWYLMCLQLSLASQCAVTEFVTSRYTIYALWIASQR